MSLSCLLALALANPRVVCESTLQNNTMFHITTGGHESRTKQMNKFWVARLLGGRRVLELLICATQTALLHSSRMILLRARLTKNRRRSSQGDVSPPHTANTIYSAVAGLEYHYHPYKICVMSKKIERVKEGRKSGYCLLYFCLSPNQVVERTISILSTTSVL